MNFKTAIMLFCMVFIGTTVSAQHKIVASAGVGSSKLTGELGKGGSFGLNYLLDAKYFLSPKLAVGLEYNRSALGYAKEDALLGVAFYGNTFVAAKGTYFLTDSKVKPYVGAALGLSRLSTPGFTITSGNQTTNIPSERKSNFGIAPHLGIMFGNFGLECSYNFSGKTPKTTYQNVTSSDKTFNFYTIAFKYARTFEF